MGMKGKGMSKRYGRQQKRKQAELIKGLTELVRILQTEGYKDDNIEHTYDFEETKRNTTESLDGEALVSGVGNYYCTEGPGYCDNLINIGYSDKYLGGRYICGYCLEKEAQA